MDEVILIAHNYSLNSLSAMSYSLARHLATKGKKIIFLSYRPHFSSPKFYTFEKGELIVYSWPSLKKPTNLNDAFWYYKIYRKYKPTIIIGHFSGAILPILLSKILSIGTAQTFCYYHTLSTQLYRYNNEFNIPKYFRYLRKKIFYKYFCTKILATSNKARKDYKEYYGANNVVSHLTPISDRFSSEVRKKRKNIIFGFLGRLHKSKGLIPLMEAFNNYWSLYPKENVILKIAGDGDLKDQIIDLSNKNINCEYLGEIEYDEVDNFIKSTTVMIIPSISDNLVTVGIETLMHQKPLIISRNTGLSEYLQPSHDCIEINSTPESIFNIICQVYKDEINLNKISENGRKTYLDNFTTQNYCEQMNIITGINI